MDVDRSPERDLEDELKARFDQRSHCIRRSASEIEIVVAFNEEANLARASAVLHRSAAHLGCRFRVASVLYFIAIEAISSLSISSGIRTSTSIDNLRSPDEKGDAYAYNLSVVLLGGTFDSLKVDVLSAPIRDWAASFNAVSRFLRIGTIRVSMIPLPIVPPTEWRPYQLP